MRFALLTALVLLTLPTSVLAARPSPTATFRAASTLSFATSTPGNLYTAGTGVVLTTPVGGDFAAGAGSIIVAAPVAGDDLLLAGSISSRGQVAGDFRAVGGNIDISEPVVGDLSALAFSVDAASRIGGSVFIVAINTKLTGGAGGPVTIYGNTVLLGGVFAGDVRVVAQSRVSIAPGTIIHGKFSYEAPEEASIPDTVRISGGSMYTNPSYLPNVGTSRILGALSVGFFLVARIVGMLIFAGLITGLFPRFAESFVNRVFTKKTSDAFLSVLLGFGVFVATPIVVVLLLLTFVGVWLAAFLTILYALLGILAFLYGGILIGGAVARYAWERQTILWHDGVLGQFVLSFVALVPIIGIPALFLLSVFSAGVLLQTFFTFAFSSGGETSERT